VPAQGGANRASSRTSQGAEDGRVHPHPAALVEGVAAGDKHGGGRELAKRGWGLKAPAGRSARRGGRGGGAAHGGCRCGGAARGAGCGGGGAGATHGGARGCRGAPGGGGRGVVPGARGRGGASGGAGGGGTSGSARRRSAGGGGGGLGRLPAARVGSVGQLPHAFPRAPGGGPREAARGSHGGGGPRTRRRGLVLPRRSLCPGGGGRRRSLCVCRRQGGAGALGRAPEPRRHAQPRAERSAACPWRPCMARLPGRPWLLVFLLSLVFACCLHVAALMGFDFVGARSSSAAPTRSTTPSIG
jgi:hypothetical protein